MSIVIPAPPALQFISCRDNFNGFCWLAPPEGYTFAWPASPPAHVAFKFSPTVIVQRVASRRSAMRHSGHACHVLLATFAAVFPFSRLMCTSAIFIRPITMCHEHDHTKIFKGLMNHTFYPPYVALANGARCRVLNLAYLL